MSEFRWTPKKEKAAIALAAGETQRKTADIVGVAQRTVERWVAIPEFSEEVDRLTFLTGIANKAERVRMAKRMIAKLGPNTKEDLLAWLKYAQSETDGIKLDLADLLAAVTADGAEMADS